MAGDDNDDGVVDILGLAWLTEIMTTSADDEVFLYTGQEAVPDDVRHVRIDHSVEVIEETFYNKRKLRVLEIFTGLKKIGWGAFQGCVALEYAFIPSSVEEIDECAFHGCMALKEVNLSDGLKKIGNSAFEGCLQLTHIKIPPSVIELSEESFSACMKLSTVVLCKGLEKIDDGVFQHCESLVSIEIPCTVAEIGGSAFYGCKQLKKVVLSEGGQLKKIDNGAFSWCELLEDINIPSGVDIGIGAFRGCDKLKPKLRVRGYPKRIWRKKIIRMYGSPLLEPKSDSDEDDT